MSDKSRLNGKRVLIVDDEADVLETIEALLPLCHVTKASSSEKAEKYLRSQDFDIAILDIMGVEGYKMLELAKERKISAIMLTAHALSVEETVKSYKKGAALFMPKDKMSEITTFLEDVFEAKEKDKSTWWRWLKRLGPYYDEIFEKDWQYKDKEFWKKFPYI